MYINPIKKNVNRLNDIQLLIDIKDFSEELLVILNTEIQNIKEHVNFKNSSVQKKITIILSGDIDKPYIVNNHFPLFYLDGRPSDLSKGHILKHCKLISDDFENYSKYQGIGNPSRKEIIKLNELIQSTHELGLPIRFWNTRNHINVWRLLNSMNVDYISVDDYLNYSNYLNRKPWDFSNNLSDH
jgi:alkaline phosphatase